MHILFITSNRLGDAVLSTGLLGHLVDHHPEARFTVACGPIPAPLFQAVPRLDRLVVLTKQPWARHWVALWGATVGTTWDLVVDLRNCAVSRLIRVRRRAILPASREDQHRCHQIAATMGLAHVPPQRLWLRDAQHDLAARLLPADGPILSLAPVANWAGKTWPIERFQAVAEALTAPDGILPDARIAVIGTAAERAVAQPLLAAVPPARLIDLMGGLDPNEAAACLMRCALFIGNDSGLMHLAAAAGTPTLGLFGPSRPEHYAPWGPHAAHVAIPYREVLSQPGFTFADQHRTWMGGLEVSVVIAAAQAHWRMVSMEARR